MVRGSQSLVQSVNFPSPHRRHLTTYFKYSIMPTSRAQMSSNHQPCLLWYCIVSLTTRHWTLMVKLRYTMHILPIMEGCPGMIGCMLSTVYIHMEADIWEMFLRDTSRKSFFLLFFRKSVIPNMTDIEGYISHGVYTLVQALEEQPMPVQDFVLFSMCTLSNEFFLVPVTSFSKLAFVVDNVGCGQKSLSVVPPMDEWV